MYGTTETQVDSSDLFSLAKLMGLHLEGSLVFRSAQPDRRS